MADPEAARPQPDDGAGARRRPATPAPDGVGARKGALRELRRLDRLHLRQEMLEQILYAVTERRGR